MLQLRSRGKRRNENSRYACLDQCVGNIPCRSNGVLAVKWHPCSAHIGQRNAKGLLRFRISEIQNIFTVHIILDERERFHPVRKAMRHLADDTFE